ncbi:MAG: cation diffusion facilitator family transporter [Nitrospira sp.]|nr:cation transporter [Candidatus Manganitrophaceae bacterium]HIL33891.1 cation transporter [Candidatus Manganitrophaceae bacterium]
MGSKHIFGGGDTLHLHAPSCEIDLCHTAEETIPVSGSALAFESVARRKLFWAILLTGVVMVIEVIGGVISNSLALLSDAGHMLTHLLALSISFLAVMFSSQPATRKKTFGFYRLEILAALLNGFLLLVVTVWIFYHAYQRFYAPEPVASLEMMAVAFIGLVTNLVTVFLLKPSTEKSINFKSAFLHIMGDTLSSGGVVLAAGVIYFTDWWFLDPLVSVAISLLILYWSFRLIMDSIDILLEATPKEIDPDRVAEAVQVIEEVRDVHDVHVWTLTSGMYALSAHVAVRDMPLKDTTHLLRKINFLLCQRFKIGHAAIQLEAASTVPPLQK